MIVLNEPYLSGMLLNYIEEKQIPVLNNTYVEKVSNRYSKLNLYNSADFVYQYNKGGSLYTVSEYALEWIRNSLPNNQLINTISILKNKVTFRKACKSLYDNFFFQEKDYNEVLNLDIKDIQLPFVLKPSVGFLSTGVYIIKNEKDWRNALNQIENNFYCQAKQFPSSVVEGSMFILESYITGREFAIDLYFNDLEPVIINIFEHLFASETDVSDRLYITSKNIFDKYLVRFTNYIKSLNKVLNIRNIPVHLELRIDSDRIVPIEINPMRFTGMCLNELHYYIAGKHPLSYFYSKTLPDYSAMWNGKEDKTFSFSIFDKPEIKEYEGIDLQRLNGLFSNILEFRPVNHSDLHLTAFVFAETSPQNLSELNKVLHYDTKQLITRQYAKFE